MQTVLRRLQGLLGLSLFCGTVWALVGAVLGTIVLVVDPAVVDSGEGPPWIAYYFGRSGLVAGVIAGSVLMLAESRSAPPSLRVWRLTLWGALGGFAVPWLAAAPAAMLPLFVVLGAGTGAATWALARRGERLSGGASSGAVPARAG